uniref:Aminomethyltransferase n=1 Tax=Magnetococcus massalia (strain MO-1) TaxID=451514 RepID=A0A1S7LGL1_MAGMO|nr:Aminomethyltransferase [Candidatus Magnetococcus massalia]
MQTTTLHARHVELGAKMVPFAGWEMPLHYGSQVQEHHAVRQKVGLFDVSHMGHVAVAGEKSVEYLQFLLANDVAKLTEDGAALYTAMLNSAGGVIDDLIVYREHAKRYHLVVNAATREGDVRWMQDRAKDFAGEHLTVIPLDNLGMIAVQGPEASKIIPKLLDDPALAELKPFHGQPMLGGWAARTGYTGEDGYELIFPTYLIESLWDQMIADGVTPAGLAARDTLRLEAGMNLYGQDMDQKIDPLSCGMGWSVAREPAERNFVGRGYLELLWSSGGSAHKRIGIVLESKAIPRAGQTVLAGGRPVGTVTSGSWSPTLEKGIAMARVEQGLCLGEACAVDIRNRAVAGRVVSLPFVRHGEAVYRDQPKGGSQ